MERNFIESTKSHTGFIRSSMLSCCSVPRHSQSPETDLSRPPAISVIDTLEQNQHEQCQGHACIDSRLVFIKQAYRVVRFGFFYFHCEFCLLFVKWCFNIKSIIIFVHFVETCLSQLNLIDQDVCCFPLTVLVRFKLWLYINVLIVSCHFYSNRNKQI